MTTKPGSIICVGTGMTLGAHLTPRAKNYIEQADVVFSLMSDGVVEQWIEQMNDDVRSLQPFYQEGTSRMISYRNMLDAMMTEVRAGKNVVGAFYGHPGVFAWVPHKIISQATSEGFFAHMEPGISAEDCLIADLGIDPGKDGCMQLEASQFMFYRHSVDTSATLILWQPSIAGDQSLARFSTGDAYRKLFVEKLLTFYPKDHVVTLYEAPTLPVYDPRIEQLPLHALITADIHLHTTLIIPASRKPEQDTAMLSRLSKLEQTDKSSTQS